jgi:hypothetical protein
VGIRIRRSREEEGSIVLEAALILPIFLAFMLLLISFIQISMAQMALQTAVSESTKVLAANMYPVELLYKQGQAQWQNSQASAWLNQVLTEAQSARQQIVDAEKFAEDYAQWIPEPLLLLVQWEKERRTQLEAKGQKAAEEAKKKVNEVMLGAATPIVAAFADERRLRREKLKVTELTFPSFDNKDEAFLGIEATYELKLFIPFFKKTIFLKKRALERVWVGGAA